MQADISVSNRLTSSIGKKVVVALTGLFLTMFLVVHLMGNLQLLKNDNGEAFNFYSKFMGHNALIQTISKVNFAFILMHAGWGLFLAFKNRAARKVRYAVNKPGANSNWYARSMAILGTLILVFIAVHLGKFWYHFKFGEVPPISYTDTVDGTVSTIKNYAMVVDYGFSNKFIVLFYVFSMVVLAYHLTHGVQSAFQTLGLNRKGVAGVLKKISMLVAVVICGLFALIPIMMYFNLTWDSLLNF